MKRKDLTGTSLNLALLNLVAFTLSILLQLLIAKNFGTTRFYDIFSVAYTIPSIFGEWLLAGASTIVMVPLLCKTNLEKRGATAWPLASTFINLLFLISLIWIFF